MKFKVLTLLLLFALSLFNPVKLRGQHPISIVKEKLNCSEDEARKFLIYTSKQIGIIQIALSFIASSERSQEDKQEIIDFLLEEIAEEDAIVFIASKITPEHIKHLPLKEYLYHLSRLSNTYNYKSVDLYYDPGFLNLNALEPFPRSEKFYDMHVLVKQYFEGVFKSYKGAYKDLTFKNFEFTIEEVATGKFNLQLKSIHVKEVLDVTKEELAKAKQDFAQYRKEFLQQR